MIAVEAAIGESVTVAVDDTVTVDVSLSMSEVEPDVRLNMTLPASTGNGVKLPRVLFMHRPVEEFPGPQQKDLLSCNGKIVMPLSGLTRRRKSKGRSVLYR